MKAGKARRRIRIPKTKFRLGELVLDPDDLLRDVPELPISPRDLQSEVRILADLEAVGVDCEEFDDLVNNRAPAEAVPVLLRHLVQGHSMFTKYRIAWSLQTKAVRVAWGDLLRVFKRCRSRLLAQDLAMVIVLAAGKEHAQDVADLCRRPKCIERGLFREWLRKKGHPLPRKRK